MQAVVLVSLSLFIVLVQSCLKMNPGDYCDPCRSYYKKGGCKILGNPTGCVEPVYSTRTKIISCTPPAVMHELGAPVDALCGCDPTLTCDGGQFKTKSGYGVEHNNYLTCMPVV